MKLVVRCWAVYCSSLNEQQCCMQQVVHRTAAAGASAGVCFSLSSTDAAENSFQLFQCGIWMTSHHSDVCRQLAAA